MTHHTRKARFVPAIEGPQRVGCYLRVSTGRQAESDLSIPDQRKQVHAFCAAKGWPVVGEYVELGASATDDNRPAFQKMRGKAVDRQDAKDRGQGGADEAERERGGGSVEIEIEPNARAEGTCIIQGQRPGADGSYRIESATHTVRGGDSPSTTKLQLKQPGDDLGKDDRKAGDTGGGRKWPRCRSGQGMADDADAEQRVMGEAVMQLWRDALEKAAEDVGRELATASMIVVGVESLREGLGPEAAAKFLDGLVFGLRTGEEVSVTVRPDCETEH